jgi:hypothetical protein
MEDTHIPIMILNTEPEGRCGVGRPNLILDDVGSDVKTVGIRRLRRKAEARTEWTVS